MEITLEKAQFLNREQKFDIAIDIYLDAVVGKKIKEAQLFPYSLFKTDENNHTIRCALVAVHNFSNFEHSYYVTNEITVEKNPVDVEAYFHLSVSLQVKCRVIESKLARATEAFIAKATNQ